MSDTLSLPSAPAVAFSQLETNAAKESAPDVSSLQFSGYAKTIVAHSSTLDGAAMPYNLSLSRLRLKLTYDVPAHFQVHIEHDTEVKAGNYLHTDAFAQEKNAPLQSYWHDSSVIVDRPGYYATQRLFRAYMKFSIDAADLTIGRQRIPLGTGLMWSTLDMLNPVNPLQVERDEYVGVDAALLEYKLGSLSKVDLVYAPDPDRLNDRWVARYKTNLNGTDFALTYGKYWTDHLVGLDFATQIGDAGVHGEWTYTVPQDGKPYRKLLLGMDYAFANTLTLSAETYYSSQTQAERLVQFTHNPQLAQVEPYGSRYAGLGISYEFTPLLKTNTYFLFNLSDHSRFVSPILSYSLTDNLTVSGGAQFFSGDAQSDFGRGQNLYYLQMQWFF